MDKITIIMIQNSGSSNISEDLPYDNSIISWQLLINNYPIFRGYNKINNDSK